MFSTYLHPFHNSRLLFLIELMLMCFLKNNSKKYENKNKTKKIDKRLKCKIRGMNNQQKYTIEIFLGYI